MKTMWSNYGQASMNDMDGSTSPRPTLLAPEKMGWKQRVFHWLFRVEEQSAQEPIGECTPHDMQQNATIEPEPVHYAASIQTHKILEIQQALRDWKASAAYFESVSDPELVDYAVYEMETAKKRYMYLLHSARYEQQAYSRMHQANDTEFLRA